MKKSTPFHGFGRLFVVLTLVLVVLPGTALAEEEKEFKQFHSIVDLALVQDIVDQKQAGLLIDSRPKKGKFDTGHIPGAISVSFTNMDKWMGWLPADKDALLVFYCQGFKCALSHKAAFKAEAAGYTNVKVYAAGYPDWKKANGPGCGDPDAGSNSVLLIEGNQNIQKVKAFLKQEGLDAAAAGPAETDQTGLFKPGRSEGSIDHEVFKKIARLMPESVILVDGREAGEFAKVHLPGAVNILPEGLEKKLADWQVDKPVIFYCNTGAKSGESYWMTRDLRPDIPEVYYVDGEITFANDGTFTIKPSK